jgi:hypothetical protein
MIELLKWVKYFDPGAIFHLIIAGVVIGRGIALLLKRKRILSRGVIVKGEIVDIKYRVGAQMTSGLPVVRFRIREDKTIKLAYRTSVFWSSLRKGKEVTVIYDKNRPTSFLIKGDFLNDLLPLLMFVTGGVMLIIAVREFLSN